MTVQTRVSRREWLIGLWRLMHPGPSLVSALAYALFAVLAAQGRPDPVKLLVTLMGMVALQFAISALNDFCDREADAQSRKVKPVALGVLSPRVPLIATAVLTAIMIACYAPYGLAPLAIATAFLILGFAYDVGLKSTPLGGVLMGLAFPLLPLLAWNLFATIKPALFWTFVIGLALGISIHLADALPDAEADSAAHAHGLAQLFGRHALQACWLFLAGANLLILLLAMARFTPARPVVLLISEPVAMALLLASAWVSRQRLRAQEQRLRANFMLTVGVALVTAVGWLISAVL